MLQELKSKKNIPTLLEEVKGIIYQFLNKNIILTAKKKKLMGFGHRIYKNYDPRAKILRKICLEVIKINLKLRNNKVLLYMYIDYWSYR